MQDWEHFWPALPVVLPLQSYSTPRRVADCPGYAGILVTLVAGKREVLLEIDEGGQEAAIFPRLRKLRNQLGGRRNISRAMNR